MSSTRGRVNFHAFVADQATCEETQQLLASGFQATKVLIGHKHGCGETVRAVYAEKSSFPGSF